MMKKISILVPCCNVEKYVRECLDSIKNQTYTNIEVICIDDGSTDSTGKILDEYAAADSRFTVIHKPNSGYGDSMNKGLEMCTGDYVGIVESDDWIEPDMYEILLQTCLDNDLDLIHCLWQQGPTGTETVDEMDWIKKNTVYSPLEEPTVLCMQPSIWAALYRHDLMEEGRKVRFLPTPGASFQDASFAFKAYTKSKRFMMLNKALHHYRINPNSSVSSSSKIFCVIDEWMEMKRWINEDKSLKEQITKSDILPRIIHGGLRWNYDRLTVVPKLMFLRAASRFLRELDKDGLFNLYNYKNREGGQDLALTLRDPQEFHNKQVMRMVNEVFEGKTQSYTGEQKDLISIIVPCYNTAKYIQSCLTSIIAQSYRNIEIICVDDCSTDDTAMIVRHMMRKDKRISFICTGKNSGLSASRNLGMKHIHGNYIMFVDGDDCLMPDAIAKLYSSMTDDCDVVIGSTKVGYEGGREAYGGIPKSDDKYYTIKKTKLVDISKDQKDILGVNVSAWGKLWRRSIIEKYDITFPEGLLYEDANFFCKYLCAAPRALMIKDKTYYYNRHLSNSIMSKTFNKEPGFSIMHLYILDDLYKFVCSRKLEEIGRKVLHTVYEPYFWFAYNYSPESEIDKVVSTMCRILKEQDADVSDNPLLTYIKSFDDVSKTQLFLDVYHLRGEIKSLKKKKSLWRKIFHRR